MQGCEESLWALSPLTPPAATKTKLLRATGRNCSLFSSFFFCASCISTHAREKGWGALRRLDRRLKREFGARATRVRSRDTKPPPPGLPDWRPVHGAVLGIPGSPLQPRPLGRCCKGSRKRFVLRRSRRVRGGQNRRAKASATRRLLAVLEGGEPAPDDGVVAEELLEEYAAVLYAGSGEERGGGGGGGGGGAAQGLRSPPLLEYGAATERSQKPAKGPPLVLFHNVTTIASRGSTLSKSYTALAEFPQGDLHGSPSSSSSSSYFSAVRKSVPAWAAADPGDEPAPAPEPPAGRPAALQPVVIKRAVRRQLRLAGEDVATARRVLRRLTFNAEVDLDLSGVLAEVAAAVSRAGDLRSEAESILRVRRNLARAGMLGSAVGVPEVVSVPELGHLAREGVLVTTALRGVDVSNTYVMQHAAPGGERERARFVDVVFKAFAHMCLADGCFPSNPMPENLLYMYSGQVSLLLLLGWSA